MFLLSLFGNHRIYSTQQLAEQNAARWLRNFVIDNHWLWKQGKTAEFRKSFTEYFQREDFAGCVKVWNNYATDYVHSSTIIVQIKAMTMDERFT